jgi:hypothetical protein
MDMSDQFHAPAALPSGKDFPLPIWQEGGWASGRSGHSGEEKKSVHIPAGNRTPVFQPTDRPLHWLSYPGS